MTNTENKHYFNGVRKPYLATFLGGYLGVVVTYNDAKDGVVYNIVAHEDLDWFLITNPDEVFSNFKYDTNSVEDLIEQLSLAYKWYKNNKSALIKGKLFSVNTDGMFIVKAADETEAFNIVFEYLKTKKFEIYDCSNSDLDPKDFEALKNNNVVTRTL